MNHPYRSASDRSDERDPRYRVTRWQRRIVRFAQWARPRWYRDLLEERTRCKLDRFLRAMLDADPQTMATARKLAETYGSSVIEIGIPSFNMNVNIPDIDLSFPFSRFDISASREYVMRIAEDLNIRVDGSDRLEDVQRKIKAHMVKSPIVPPDPVDLDE